MNVCCLMLFVGCCLVIAVCRLSFVCLLVSLLLFVCVYSLLAVLYCLTFVVAG